MCKFRSFFANMKTYTNKNITFTANLELCINLKHYIMASRRNLKKKITNIASDLFLVSLMEGVNREVVCNSVHNVIKLIIRISHTEPGNVKGFYKKLNEDLNKEIKVVADELAKATKA